jgi:hypothetical protein
MMPAPVPHSHPWKLHALGMFRLWVPHPEMRNNLNIVLSVYPEFY